MPFKNSISMTVKSKTWLADNTPYVFKNSVADGLNKIVRSFVFTSINILPDEEITSLQGEEQ